MHLTDVDRLRGYHSGAVDYISVPVVPDVLRAKVGIFTELHRKRRQLQELNRDLEARVVERSEALRVLNSQLQERVAELESIMRVLPVGVAVAHDAECEFVTGNAAFSRILGIPLETISQTATAPIIKSIGKGGRSGKTNCRYREQRRLGPPLALPNLKSAGWPSTSLVACERIPSF